MARTYITHQLKLKVHFKRKFSILNINLVPETLGVSGVREISGTQSPTEKAADETATQFTDSSGANKYFKCDY